MSAKGFSVWRLDPISKADVPATAGISGGGGAAQWGGPFTGDRGGKYWQNMRSGEKFYGDEKPGGDGGGAAEEPGAVGQPGQPQMPGAGAAQQQAPVQPGAPGEEPPPEAVPAPLGHAEDPAETAPADPTSGEGPISVEEMPGGPAGAPTDVTPEVEAASPPSPAEQEMGEPKPEPVAEEPLPAAGAILGKPGAPGIMGMTQAQAQAVINKASADGYDEKPPDTVELKEDGTPKAVNREAWGAVWDVLFPLSDQHTSEDMNIDMSRVPRAYADPGMVTIHWDRLNDPHATTIMNFVDNSGTKQTCNTVLNLVNNDVDHWVELAALGGGTAPLEGEHELDRNARHGDTMLRAMTGRLEEGEGNPEMRAINDLSHGLRRDWSNTENDARKRDSAMIAALIMETGKRRGQKKQYVDSGGEKRGITTLHAGDIKKIDGDTVHVKFIGKGGTENGFTVTDPALANYLNERRQGKKDDERLFDATDESVDRSFVHNASPTSKPKDYRTLFATSHAQKEIAHAEEPMAAIPQYKEGNTSVNTGEYKQGKVKAKVPRQGDYKEGNTNVKVPRYGDYKDKGTKNFKVSEEKGGGKFNGTHAEAHQAGHLSDKQARDLVGHDVHEMSYQEAHQAGHLNDKQALKHDVREMSIEDAHTAGHIGGGKTSFVHDDSMTHEEAHAAGRITDAVAYKKEKLHMRIKDAVESGHLSRDEALEHLSSHILKISEGVQKQMNHANMGVTVKNYIHPEVFQTYLDHHGIGDMIPPVLNPYAKHRRKKSIEFMFPVLMSNLHKGYRVVVKAGGFGHPEPMMSHRPTHSHTRHAHLEPDKPLLGDYKPDEDVEEEIHHWPPWILHYGMTEEQRKRLRGGEKVHFGELPNPHEKLAEKHRQKMSGTEELDAHRAEFGEHSKPEDHEHGGQQDGPPVAKGFSVWVLPK